MMLHQFVLQWSTVHLLGWIRWPVCSMLFYECAYRTVSVAAWHLHQTKNVLYTKTVPFTISHLHQRKVALFSIFMWYLFIQCLPHLRKLVVFLHNYMQWKGLN